MDGPKTPPIKSPEEMGGRFQAELMMALPEWKKRLQGNPDCLVEIEQDVHQVFARGADMLVSGLIGDFLTALIALVPPTSEFAMVRVVQEHPIRGLRTAETPCEADIGKNYTMFAVFGLGEQDVARMKQSDTAAGVMHGFDDREQGFGNMIEKSQ